MTENKKRVPWYLWPFWLIYQLTLGILKITGRILGAVLGLVVLILGALLCATVIGAILRPVRALASSATEGSRRSCSMNGRFFVASQRLSARQSGHVGVV